LPGVIGGSVLIYGSFVLAEIAIVRRGHRFLWTVPPLAFVLLGVFVSPHAPNAIGSPWFPRCFDVCSRPWYLGPWAGPIADLGLVMVPGVVAIAASKRVHSPRRLGDAPTIAAILLCMALAVMVHRTAASLGGAPDLAPFAAVVAFGLLAGTVRPWWPWAHLAFAAIASGALATAVSGAARVSYPWPPRTWVPVVAAGLIACMWEPLASLFRRESGRPLSLLVAVNVLNIADAVFTEFGVRSGKAVELNPLVRFGGLPLKIVVVGALT
jgi:hypothetical protein